MRKKEGGSQPLPEINHDYKAGHKIAPPQTEQGSTPTSSTFSSQKTVMDYVTLERSEEHTSELQSQSNLVCRLLLEKKTTKLRTVFIPKLSEESVVISVTGPGASQHLERPRRYTVIWAVARSTFSHDNTLSLATV